MKKVLSLLIIILALVVSPVSLFADQISVTHTQEGGSFPLVESGNAAIMVVDPLDA